MPSTVNADDRIIVSVLESERERLQRILNKENPQHETYRNFKTDYDLVDGVLRRFKASRGL